MFWKRLGLVGLSIVGILFASTCLSLLIMAGSLVRDAVLQPFEALTVIWVASGALGAWWGLCLSDCAMRAAFNLEER